MGQWPSRSALHDNHPTRSIFETFNLALKVGYIYSPCYVTISNISVSSLGGGT